MINFIGKQAVVVGAGLAGLTAARALADYFERVIVLERDALPADAGHRKGTPQSRHLHGLLPSGLGALNELFPQFTQDLDRSGAIPLRAGLDVRVERPGYDPFPQRDLGWASRAMSRPLVELTLRQSISQCANIELRQRCRVQNFVAGPGSTTITGVRFENVGGGEETTTSRSCDRCLRARFSHAAAASICRSTLAGGNKHRHRHHLCIRRLRDSRRRSDGLEGCHGFRCRATGPPWRAAITA